MAKTKVKTKEQEENESLAEDDIFTNALVPEEEQPYKIPDNWMWVRLGDVAKWGSGGTPSRKIPNYYRGNIPWIKTGELEENYIFDTEEKITEDAVKNSNAKLFPKNTIVLAMYGATIGKIAIMGVPSTTNQACACGIAAKKINYKYLFFYLLSQKNIFIMKGKGGAQPNISQEIIKSHIIPLPPLLEQQHIIKRIENLFKKLDRTKELVQYALDSFETRKAAILHKAFSGELTAKWRKENGIKFESWKMKTLNDVAEYKKGPFDSSITKAMFVPKSKNTYKVYEQGNAIRKTIAYGNYYINESKYNELKGFSINPSDIIISCAGTIGEVYKLPDNCEKGVINQALMRVRIKDNIEEKYFILFFGEILKKDINDKAKGTAINNIPPFSVMKAMSINLPSLPEQQEIVRILDCLFEKERRARELCGVIGKIDLMKKAILARAFRGELGTGD